jgi:hypothetical protein
MSRKSAFLVFVAVLLSPSFVSAQDTPRQYLAVQTITVATGMRAQFEMVAGEIRDAYKQTNAEPQNVSAWMTMNGGNNRTYRFVWQFDDLSEMDAWRQIPDVLAEAYGEEEAAKLLLDGDATLDNVVTSIEMLQTPASSRSGQAFTTTPTYATVITTAVDFSGFDDYNIYLEKLKEAEDQADLTWTRRWTIQGEINRFTAVRLHNSLGDSGTGAYGLLREHLGTAEADLLIERQNDVILRREIEVLRRRPDLSRP